MGAFFGKIEQMLFYQTVKIVQIKSWKLGLLHYLIMLGLIIYVGFYAIYWKGGYQATDEVLGNVNIKVKGVAKDPQAQQVWDMYDVVMPPMEQGAVFLTTNFLLTPKQTRTTCSGNDQATERCPCTDGKITKNGISTGNCNSQNFCDIQSWCPLEDDVSPSPNTALQGLEDFTLFIRADVKWPTFNISRVNIVNGLQQDLNFFNVSGILKAANLKYDDIKAEGAIVACFMQWNCDFDKSLNACLPEISFTRLDNPVTQSFSRGFNYRYVSKYRDQTSNTLYRDLTKVYGLRLIVVLSGTGRRFDFVPLFTNVGSGLGLLGVATIISDVLLLYFLPKRKVYHDFKISEIESTEVLNDEEERRLNGDRQDHP